MTLIVQKFGGTSVGDIERIEQVADKVARFRDQGHDIVVVVSAMAGETNRLIALAHEVQDRPARNFRETASRTSGPARPRRSRCCSTWAA